jgi:2,3-bisphosphoglycerate-independent phosphoglycerate mutase
VPFIVVDDSRIGAQLRSDGKLCDIAPTLLSMLGLDIPREMTGKSIIAG